MVVMCSAKEHELTATENDMISIFEQPRLTEQRLTVDLHTVDAVQVCDRGRLRLHDHLGVAP